MAHMAGEAAVGDARDLTRAVGATQTPATLDPRDDELTIPSPRRSF